MKYNTFIDPARIHWMSVSGGSASALSAFRLIEAAQECNVPMDQIMIYFADTKWEDEDLYRFNDDCFARYRAAGAQIITYADGRNPLQVAEKKSIIPNNRMAPCSMQLKVMPFRMHIKASSKPVTVYLGMDWKEQHRMVAPRESYGAMIIAGEPVQVDFPLMWKPTEYRPYTEVLKDDYGIQAPRLYARGHPHNNCKARCIRQGKEEWVRLLINDPESFNEVMEWEEAQRAKGGARANRSICEERVNGQKVPLTLKEIKRRYEAGLVQVSLFSNTDDRFTCYCTTA